MKLMEKTFYSEEKKHTTVFYGDSGKYLLNDSSKKV